MIVLRFRDNMEHQDLMKKVKKMKKALEEIEMCLEENSEDDGEFRRDFEEEDEARMRGRYGYRRSYRGRM